MEVIITEYASQRKYIDVSSSPRVSISHLKLHSGGVGPSPLTKKLCEKLYPGKKSRGFVVENNLRLKNHDGVFA